MAPPSALRSRSFSGYVCVLLASILAGLGPTAAKPLLGPVNPVFFAAIVVLAPSAVFAPLSARRVPGERRFTRRILLVLLGTSMAGGLAAPLAYLVGLQRTTASDAAVLANAEMVFTVLIAVLFFRERLSRAGVAAVVLLTLGVTVVASNGQFSLQGLASLGNLSIVGATFLWALDNNVTSSISRGIQVVKLVALKSAIAGPSLLAIAFLTGTSNYGGSLGLLLYLVVIGIAIFSGSLFFTIESMRRIGAVLTTISFPVSSLFGLAFAFLILGEGIGAYQVAAVAIVFLGIYLLTRPGSVVREGLELKQY